MKYALLFFILLPILSLAQSKKDLKARIYSMQVDSASQAELVKNLRSANAAAEQTISDQLAVLREAQQKIAEMYDRISELSKDLGEVQEEKDTLLAEVSQLDDELLAALAVISEKEVIISSLEEEFDNLRSEKELLEDELALTQEDPDNRNMRYAQGDEYREVIDFKYDYERHRAAGGIFPPLIYPIGWNDEAVVVYKEDICDGGCGCCRTSIVIRDIKSNTTLDRQAIRSEDIWDDESYRESTRQLLASYKIMPTGMGTYVNSSTYNGEKGSIGVSIEKSTDRFRVYKTEDDQRTNELIYTGELTIGMNEVRTEVECIGYFLPEMNNYVVFVLLLRDNGYETDQDYTIELVGVELP